MMDFALLVLVGLPGSGKSTVGRQLARRLDIPFLDSDHAIEQRLGCSIREYFERQGEERFRDVETEVLAQLVQQAHGVLSTGGGSVLREQNRDLLRQSGQVFYLYASPQEVFRRLRNDQNRPLLQVADPQLRLRELFEVRDPLYRAAAHYVIECPGCGEIRLELQENHTSTTDNLNSVTEQVLAEFCQGCASHLNDQSWQVSDSSVSTWVAGSTGTKHPSQFRNKR
jgi:shikimate kinase